MSVLVENKVLLSFLHVLIFSLIILLLPLLLVVVMVLVPFRQVLTLYKNIFKPDYGDILGGMDNILSTDDPYDTNPELNLGCHGWIKGHLKLDDFRLLCEKKMRQFESQRPQPWFCELKQYLTTWLGFSVWRNEKNFQISDHVKMLKDVDPVAGAMEISEDNVADLCFQLNKIPYKRGTSPWEFILHHNVRFKDMHGNPHSGHDDHDDEDGQVTLIVTKFHHSLCDALSILNLLSNIFDQPEAFERFVKKFSKSVQDNQKNDENLRRNLLEKIFFIISYPVLGLHDLIKHVFEVWDDNVWHHGWPETRKEFLFTSFDSIPTHRVKRVREVHGQVKFVSVCLGALTAAIRKYMIRHDIPVPQCLHASISVAMPKDTTKLGNNVFASVVPMPTGLNDRAEIIQFIDQGARSFQKSRLPLTMLAISHVIGILPKKFVGRIMIFTTCLMTNFPGFDSVLQICGCPLITIRGFAILRSTTGVYFFVSGYMGQLDLLLGISKHIMDSMDQVLELRRYVEEEFEALENPKNNLVILPINNQTTRVTTTTTETKKKD